MPPQDGGAQAVPGDQPPQTPVMNDSQSSVPANLGQPQSPADQPAVVPQLPVQHPVAAIKPPSDPLATEEPVPAVDPISSSNPVPSIATSDPAATQSPDPLAQPMAQQPAPAAVAPQAQPLQQPLPVDASQSGAQPQRHNMGVFGDVSPTSNKQKTMKGLVALAVLVLVVAGGFFIVRGLTDSGRVGKLVDDSVDDVGFVRPESWLRTERDDGIIFFAEEEGADLDKLDLGLLVSKADTGIEYSSLSDTDKETIKTGYETQFSGDSSFGNDACGEVTGTASTEVQREGYDLAFILETTCSELVGKGVGGVVKLLLGWQNSEIHIVGIVANNDIWSSDGAKLDEILASVRPTN